jgi:FG-GAP-like repeat
MPLQFLRAVCGPRPMARVVAGILGLAGFAGAQFAPPVNLPVGSSPDWVATGDWDGDHDIDIAVPVQGPQRVVFLFNDGTGVFGNPVSVPMTGGPYAIVSGDFDQDGDTDVAVTLQNADAVRVLLNNGSGSFTLGSLTATGAGPRSIRTADFNGGAPDLVTANSNGNSVSVLLNTGAGSFTTATLPTDPDPRDVTVGDLNGDGDVDFAIVSHDASRINLFANNGAGVFTAAGLPNIGSELRPDGIVAADLDHDGDLDLVAAVSHEGGGAVVRFPNAGPGTGAGQFPFFDVFNVAAGDPQRLAAADIDRDGSIDIVTANQTSNSVTVLFNNGAGNFVAALVSAVGLHPQMPAVADIDGNGSPDVIVANDGSGSVSVLIDTDEPSAFSDLGLGLAGLVGIPVLKGNSPLKPGSPVSLSLIAAPANAPVALVIGLHQIDAPFKGGTLVPAPNVILPLSTDIIGSLALAGTFPPGVPSTTHLFVQVIVVDAAAPQGFSLSNALLGDTP